MDGRKMVRLFLILALAMTVASQPLETIATSGGVTLSTQLLNWVQVGVEAFLVWVGYNTEEDVTQYCCLNTSMPRILVVTGNGDNQNKTEIWPKLDSKCALEKFPLGVYGAVGFWTAQGPTVCGGEGGGNKCFIYMEHQWKPWTNMGTARKGASALQINPNQALIIGGIDESWNVFKSTELISSSGSEEGKDFPVRIIHHCSFPINATHGMVTGGKQDGSWSSTNTWFVDLTTTTVTPGPTMKTGRSGHGCSIFHLGRKTFAIVSGGRNERFLDSTEMIDFDQESSTWAEGPKFPRELLSLTLAETSQGTYAMGGWDGENYRNEVFQLDCPEDQIQSCHWKEVENLQVARSEHVSIPLPESYDICN